MTEDRHQLRELVEQPHRLTLPPASLHSGRLVVRPAAPLAASRYWKPRCPYMLRESELEGPRPERRPPRCRGGEWEWGPDHKRAAGCHAAPKQQRQLRRFHPQPATPRPHDAPSFPTFPHQPAPAPQPALPAIFWSSAGLRRPMRCRRASGWQGTRFFTPISRLCPHVFHDVMHDPTTVSGGHACKSTMTEARHPLRLKSSTKMGCKSSPGFRKTQI